MQNKIEIGKRLYWCDQPHEKWYEHIFDLNPRKNPHVSKHMFDIFSFTHIFWPLLMVLLSKKIFGRGNYIIIFILTILFEIYENIPANIIKYHRIEIDSSGKSHYRGDSWINIIGDIIFNGIGVYLGYMCTDTIIIIILMLILLIITTMLGINYWIDFFRFLLTGLTK